MNELVYKPQFAIQQATYDTTTHKDVHAFMNAKGAISPALLTQTLIEIMGDMNTFPLVSSLYGKAGEKAAVKYIDTDDPNGTYWYPVSARKYKPAIVSETVNNTPETLGRNPTKSVVVYFTDNSLHTTEMVMNPDTKTLARVQSVTEAGAGRFKVVLSLNNPSKDALFPIGALTAGAKWVTISSAVSFIYSYDGGQVNTYLNGKVKNQLTYTRMKFSWGNYADVNRVMNIDMTLPIPSKDDPSQMNQQKSKVWISKFLYEFEIEWLRRVEHLLWYSRYNSDATGVPSLTDPINNELIPTGGGILEQILNHRTYTKLTYDFLSTAIGDALYGYGDMRGKVIEMHTGTGGIRMMNEAMKGYKDAAPFQMVVNADKFLEGENYELKWKGFFNGFHHVDGYMIKVVYNPIFDYGTVAVGSKRFRGLSKESYRMVFLDRSMKNGEQNIQLVKSKKQPMQHGIERGLTDPPADLSIADRTSVAGNLAPTISSSSTQGIYHRLEGFGVQVLAPHLCCNFELA